MKRNYLAPHFEVVTIEIEDAILALSDELFLENFNPGVTLGDPLTYQY